ncbi:MAG TPA: hypothetical protein VEK34_11715 [Methylocella sp.]|nr:hypothetical protein [Methylocella sp.]
MKQALSAAFNANEPPADAAAKILVRLGLSTLFIGLPLLSLFWRSAIYVLLPVGALLILSGALFQAPETAGRRLRAAFSSPITGAALFLVFWAFLSLFWTPFPGEAADRLIKSAGSTLLAVFVAIYLPQRKGSLDEYLLPFGLAMTAAATLAVVLLSLISSTFEVDGSLFERAMVTCIVLVWPALGILSAREHWIPAAVLAILIASVALVGFAQIALLAMGASAFTFASAMSNPVRTGRTLALASALLVLLAPALPFLYRFLLWLTGIQAGSASAGLLIWSDLMVSHWARLITGHGFNFVHQGLSYGYLPERAPKSLLFIIWYELGAAGAVGFTLLSASALWIAGTLPAKVAPALLAGLVAILTIAILGIATAQIWWLTLLDCDLIAFTLLLSSGQKMQRLEARAFRAAEVESAK